MSKKSFSLSEAADLEKPFIGQPKITPQALDEILARYDARMAERVASPSSMASNDNRVVCSYSFFEEVKDEGGFWEKRDLKALVETVGQWNIGLAGLFGQIKDQFRDQIIAAPISDFPNFEHLEAEGRKGEDDSPG